MMKKFSENFNDFWYTESIEDVNYWRDMEIAHEIDLIWERLNDLYIGKKTVNSARDKHRINLLDNEFISAYLNSLSLGPHYFWLGREG